MVVVVGDGRGAVGGPPEGVTAEHDVPVRGRGDRIAEEALVVVSWS